MWSRKFEPTILLKATEKTIKEIKSILKYKHTNDTGRNDFAQIRKLKRGSLVFQATFSMREFAA